MALCPRHHSNLQFVAMEISELSRESPLSGSPLSSSFGVVQRGEVRERNEL
jgi:hypothetical protein